MDLPAKIRSLPASAGVYLYKNAEGEVIYVGKAKNLRSRVSSYFREGRWEDAKTDSLVREAVDVDYIVVANNKEALALENHLIKQKKPRFNILLRDDKTYPYVKLTLGERFPRVYVTRRLRKDGSSYYGPYFPANLAYRIVDLIHRHFMVPSCKVDLTRYHPRPCLQYYIKRCLGPCVEALDHAGDLSGSRARCETVSRGTSHRSVAFASPAHGGLSRIGRIRACRQVSRPDLDRRSVAGEAAHCFGRRRRRRRFRLPLRKRHAGGKSVSHARRKSARPARILLGGPAGSRHRPRRDGYHQRTSIARQNKAPPICRRKLQATTPEQPAFIPGEFFSAFLNQLYIGQPYVPRNIYAPVDFEDREALEDLLSEQVTGGGARPMRVNILVPQRGDKRALLDLAGNNAKQSYDQRFRVMKPNAKAIQEALQDVLGLPELPKRIECFDISHIQGAETVASMVVWEDGQMKKSDYRKFIIRDVTGVDDFASMREVVTRRYKRIQEENKKMPSLVLIDGGLGQLHAAAEALEALEIINQPLAAIAKREEIIYVYGQESEPVALDHHSPVLHLVQLIRDEAHRFAVTFHRKRRQIRDRSTELREIPGVGESTTRRLLQHFGSLQAIKQADSAALSSVVTRSQAEAILDHFRKQDAPVQ